MIAMMKKPHYKYIIFYRKNHILSSKKNCNIGIIRLVKKNCNIKKNRGIEMTVTQVYIHECIEN